MSDVPVAVIVASTREERLGGVVAEWFAARVAARGGYAVDLIDLDVLDLPARMPSGHPARGEQPEWALPLAARIGAADGIVVVTPEYNHGYPGSLKNAIDLVHREWRAKPVAFVSYGGLSGGMRAVEQLRLVFAELHVVTLRDAVVLPFAARAFRETGAPDDPDGRIADGVTVMLDRLEWWARALARARAEAPYDG